MATVGEVKIIVERLDEKVEAMTVQLAAHMATDKANTEKLTALWQDVHGDGNGKRGIRRELDDVKHVMSRYERLSGIITAAAITSAVTAAVGLILR